MPQIIFLTHLYNSCSKGFVFPIFPSLDYSSLQPFNQPITLQTCPTVPTGPTDHETPNWTASTSLIHCKHKCTQIQAFLASI
jgi:hypothetical protein